MPIAFNHKEAMAFAVVEEDRIFAEPLQINSMIPGRYTTEAQADPTRPERTVMGIYTEKPVMKQALDQSPQMGRMFATEFAVTDINVHVLTAALFVEGALVLPKKGDQITRLSEPDFPVLEVTGVFPSGALRTTLAVVKKPS